MRTTIIFVCLMLVPSLRVLRQDSAQDHSVQACEMMRRGDQAMGFSQKNTTHHFRLLRDGGEIDVEANDPKDMASVDQIRAHLAHIAKLFSAGDFDVPMFIHATTPPGVTTMERQKDKIRYQFSETDRGARVRITTVDAQAIDAVHAFLLFQMADHHTGDSPKIVDDLPKN